MGVLAFLISLAALTGVAGLGVVQMKRHFQLVKDQQLKVYNVIFPTTTDSKQLEAWFHSISGILTDQLFGLLGTYTVVLEVRARQGKIEHTLMVPWQKAEAVISLLRANIPGVEVVAGTRQQEDWTRVAEFEEKSPAHTLDIPDPAQLSTWLLRMMSDVDTGETLMMQWIIASMRPSQKPTEGPNADALADKRIKLGERGMRASLRVGAIADTERRADYLIGKIKEVLASTATPHNRIKAIRSPMMFPAEIKTRIRSTAFPLVARLHLTLSELSGLIGIPLGNPQVAGLMQGATRQIAPTEAIASEGRIIGHSDYHGRERPIAVSFSQDVSHTWILGASGMGKSTAMAEMAVQDMAAGHGVVLIESSGDLFSMVLDRIPRSRMNDVIVLDVTDTAYPLGFNVLRQGAPDVVLEELAALLGSGDGSSIYNDKVLHHALKTLMPHAEMTFADLEPLISPLANQVDWHEEMKRNVTDAAVKGFWQGYDDMGKIKAQQYVQPTLNRSWRLMSRDVVKNIIGQPTSSFDMREVVRDNKILLINLRGLPPETASIMGTLFVNALWRSVKNIRPDRPNFLYMDEVHQYVGTSNDPRVMFAEARKFNLGLVVAHQYLKQLSPNLTAAIMANATTKIVFRTEAEDGNKVSQQFAGTVTGDELLNLRKHHAVARLEDVNGRVNTVTLSSLPPSKPTGLSGYIMDRNRYLYGRPSFEVERSFETRYHVEKPASRKRKRAFDEWDVKSQ